MTAQQANFRDEVLDEVKKIARAPVATLQGVLKPLHFDAELAQYVTHFVIGTRQWVFDDVEAWRCGESGRCR